YQDEMLKLINRLKLDDVVVVIKNPPRGDVIAAYGQSEFLVLPSHWELSPLVPLESFAFKKPVISTKSHGTPYTVQDQITGLLVEPENPKELSKAMIDLLENKVLREKLGLAGYEFVHKECNSVSMAQNSLSLYQEIIKNNPNK
ncbi:uncharacterized protein METZ01_LOCUS489202, partial [marine metagenome]